MKQLLFIVAIITTSLTFTQAQSDNSRFGIGIRGGVNFTKLLSGQESDLSYAKGLNIAIPIEIGLSKNLSFQPELHYVQKGYEFVFGERTSPLFYKESSRTNYLELPLLLKAKASSGNILAYVIAGPTFGYAMNGKIINQINGESQDPRKIDFGNTGSIQDNRLDIGASFGLGIELGIRGGAFVLDGRYNVDLNDNLTFENGEPDTYKGIHNSGIAVTFGYMFRF